MASHPDAEQIQAWMTRIYGQFVVGAAPEFAKTFAQLEQDKLPLLYHCTAGKDRTGVFSALLLLALGVPEKTVLEDYSLTNKYLLENENSPAMQATLKASNDSGLSKLPKDQRDVLMRADPAYLQSALRQIDTQYGSFDNYRRDALHVSDAEVATLRSRLTTQ